MPTRFTSVVVLALLFTTGLDPLITRPDAPSGIAWADDDDDDDDDRRSSPRTRRDDSGLTPFSPRTRQPQRTAPRPRTATPAPAPQPDFAPDEIVTLGLSGDDLALLVAQGFAVIEETDVPGLAATPRRLAPPDGLTLADARDLIRALPTGEDADFNHFYRSEQGFSEDCQGSDCPARRMIDWDIPPDRTSTCGNSVPIGMIDTGINEEHETFAGAHLDVKRLGPDNFDRSRALHGTAVAALLVGDPQTRSPGLVPGTRLVAVDAFYRTDGDERADIFTLLKALGHLADEGVMVINLSLAGPANAVLEESLRRLVFDEDIVVVSAVGNSGPGVDPEYPAGYDAVIAVTAVDRNGAIYRRAVRGAHVDLAAPGVNVWTAASVSGARFKTGTSFAVPFVTAAAALVREARPDLGAVAVGQRLREWATDLGDPGHDDTFGAGLLNISGLCDPTL